MHVAIRPLVTTGLALVGAAVIIANPIALPPPDVAIRADQAAVDTNRGLFLLDPAFLAAVASLDSHPTDSPEFVPELVTALSVGGPPVSRDAIESAYAAGLAVVSGWPQATSVANLPDGVGSSNGPSANPTVNFQQTLAKLVEDANDVGAQVVASAFAAGAVAAAMPTLIASTATSAATGDLTAALYSAASAVIAPLGPPALVVDTVRTVIEQQVATVTGAAPAAPDVAVQAETNESPTQPVARAGQRAAGTAAPDQPAAEITKPAAGAGPETADTTDGVPASADGDGITQGDTSSNGATDLSDGNKVEPGADAQRPGPILTSLERLAEQLRRLAEQRGTADGPDDGSGTDGPSGPAGAGNDSGG